MQGMRRGKEHRLHARVGNGLVEIRRELEALGGREIAHQIGLLADSTDEMQALALALHGFDDVLAPASEANNGGIDHGLWLQAAKENCVIIHCSARSRKGNASWMTKSNMTAASSCALKCLAA